MIAGRIRGAWRRELTSRLEPLRRRFRRRRGKHERLRRHLNQARMGVTYDDYLTRVAFGAVTAAVVVGGLVFLVLQAATVIGGTSLRAWLLVTVVAGGAGGATGVGAWLVGYNRPKWIATRRARELDATLPRVVTYMYALAHGGIDPVEVVRRTARRGDTYGEQAREMQLIVNEMDYLGSDFVTALHNAADLTPCEATSDFLGDMVGVLESGGDVEEFLEERRQRSVESLTNEQESYLERLGLYAELYVSLLVAAPLFVIVLLLIIGVVGSSSIGAVNALVYVGLPLGTGFAILFLDRVDMPFNQRTHGTSEGEDEQLTEPEDPDVRDYAARKRRDQRRERLKSLVPELVESPLKSLVLTTPLAVLAIGLVWLSGIVTPSVASFRARPLTTTALFGVAPFLLVATPLSILYELRRRFADRVQQRFPDVLSSVARANRSGISTAQAIEMEAERSGGPIERELLALSNDIRWFDDPSEAFLALADRARLGRTKRTMRLLAEANRASGDLHRTLHVAAADASFQRQFREARVREVGSYVAVAVISFLVFLGIILSLQQFYLVKVVEAAAQSAATDVGAGMPGSLQDIDAAGFRLAFLHATLIQGACIGLVAGKLSRGTALAGVKYSIGMVLVSVVAFGVV